MNTTTRLPSVALLFALHSAKAQEISPPRIALPLSSYHIQAGDQLEVLYRITPEYNQTVSVLPDGTVSLTLLGQVPMKGLTLEEAKRSLHERAALRLNNPELSITLRDYERPHFTIFGEVANPGRYELRGSLSTIDGVAIAGGFKNSARHTQILLIRRVSETVGETRLLDFKALEKTQEGQELIALRDGDIVVVPQSKLSKVERYIKLANTGVYYNPTNH